MPAGVLEYTTTPQEVVPSATDGLSVTPSGTAFAFSAWVELIASTANAIALTSIAVDQGVDDVFYLVEIGTGSGGAETTLAQLRGHARKDAATVNQVLYFHPPVQVPASTRVAVRMLKAGTNVTAWRFAVTYHDLPLAGAATVMTTGPTTPFNAVAVTPNGTAWVNSAWSQQTASSGTDLAISHVLITFGLCADLRFEVDIGVGGAGAEVVVWTGRGVLRGAGACVALGGPLVLPVLPLITIPSGSRIAIRMRKEGTSTANWFFDLTAFQTLSGLAAHTTEQVQAWTPSAAAGANVTNGGDGTGGSAWAPGAYTEFIASTATAIAVATLKAITGVAGDERIYEIATGAAGAEVVVGRVRIDTHGNGDDHTIPIRPAIAIGSGVRVAIRLRTRSTAANTDTVAIGHLPNPDFDLRTTTVSASWPNNANAASVTPNGTAWVSSSWAEVVASVAASSLITDVVARPGAGSPREYEVDLGAGGAGAETVIATLRGHYGGNAGQNYLRLVVPVHVAAGTRISARFRGAGTNTTAWGIAARYVEYDPANPPVGLGGFRRAWGLPYVGQGLRPRAAVRW